MLESDSEHLQVYLNRYRRLAVGPSVSVVFENARTLQFRMMEVERMRRLHSNSAVQRMLDWYAGLLPTPTRLCAAVTVRRPGRRPSPGLNDLAVAISSGSIDLQLGKESVGGQVIPLRAGDRILGPALWVRFQLSPAQRQALLEITNPARLSIIADGYVWESELFSTDLRSSLADDLTLSH